MYVLSLSWDNPQEEEMTTYSIILAWEIPWTEKPDGYSPWGTRESDMTERLSTHTDNIFDTFPVWFSLSFIDLCLDV